MNTKQTKEEQIKEILKQHTHTLTYRSEANNTTVNGMTISAFVDSEGIEKLSNLITRSNEEYLRSFRTWLIRTYGEGNKQMEGDSVIDEFIKLREVSGGKEQLEVKKY